MKENFLKLFSVLMSSAILLSSCSSATMISTVNTDKAKVYINDEYKGETPYKQKDLKVVGSNLDVKLKKEGFEDFDTTIVKDERVNVGAIIGGLFFLFPFIWTMGYDKEHKYEMQPIKADTDSKAKTESSGN